MNNYSCCKQYSFLGYDAYYKNILPVIEQIIAKVIHDEDSHYILAINEAVCNAARYGIEGLDKVAIDVRLHITQNNISTTIRAHTRIFDAARYRKKLRNLLEDEALRDMDWGDYAMHMEDNRGFWYMLMACDYLYMDASGQDITLCARIPCNAAFSAKISDLVPRFLIKRNEVIS
jgi:hypothetical protein